MPLRRLGNTLERFEQLASEDKTGDKAVEFLYFEVMDRAKEATGFVIDDLGVLNRPNDVAGALALAMRDKALAEHGLLATLVGVIAAVLFPRPASAMSEQERDELRAFTTLYIGRTVTGQLALRVMHHVRLDLLPLVRCLKPVIDSRNGVPEFAPHRDPYVLRAQCDLALLYHMRHQIAAGTEAVRSMHRFVYAMMDAAPEGEPSIAFSRSVLDLYVRKHLEGHLDGQPPPSLMGGNAYRGLMYRLYVTGVLDARFAKGSLLEDDFCAFTAQCTKREPGHPSVPIIDPPTSTSRDRRTADHTA